GPLARAHVARATLGQLGAGPGGVLEHRRSDPPDLRRSRLVTCGRERVGPPNHCGRRAADHQGCGAFPVARCATGGRASRGWIREPSKGVLMPSPSATPDPTLYYLNLTIHLSHAATNFTRHID